MTPGKSNFLNFLRWFAALIVVLGHVDMYLKQFDIIVDRSVSFAYVGMHAHAAVMIFFVLSGYVVAYATDKKRANDNYNFREFFLDRWSRIYSVLLLSIIFTLLIDYFGKQFNQVYYDSSFIPQDKFLLRLFVNIFSLQGIQGYRVQLGSNPALWSIGYEFTFYILFGLILFRNQLFKNKFISPVICFVIISVIGLKMMVYFGVWLLGVLIYHVAIKSKLSRFNPGAWVGFFVIISTNHLINFRNLFGLTEIIKDIVFAIAIAIVLTFEPRPPKKWQICVNSYLADFSYSVYAFHMPLIFFMCSIFIVPLKNMPYFLPGLILSTACLVLGRGFYNIGESRRASYKLFGASILKKLDL